MAEYIDRNAFRQEIDRYYPFDRFGQKNPQYDHAKSVFLRELAVFPAAGVVEEENILKFYYVRSIDEYWIGRRIDNFYYAEYDPESCRWIWTHSRYLPWGKHIVSPTSLWKEHTYPSEPEEIPFEEWLQGFVKKHAADVAERKAGKWETDEIGCAICSVCGNYAFETTTHHISGWYPRFCPNCGAKMEVDDDV